MIGSRGSRQGNGTDGVGTAPAQRLVYCSHVFTVTPTPMAQAASLPGHPRHGVAGIDLAGGADPALRAAADLGGDGRAPGWRMAARVHEFPPAPALELGRASCRESVV